MVVTFTSTYVFSTYRLESEKFDPKWQCLRNRNICNYLLLTWGRYVVFLSEYSSSFSKQNWNNSNVKFTSTINFKIRVLVIQDKKYINCYVLHTDECKILLQLFEILKLQRLLWFQHHRLYLIIFNLLSDIDSKGDI